MQPPRWQDAAERIRPFVAQRVPSSDVDDVMQEVFVRMQRGIGSLRDEERVTSWLFQIARNAIVDHLRVRGRHPLGDGTIEERVGDVESIDDERAASRDLSRCISLFVAGLPSPYREAVTLVELEGLTAREAAEMVGVSVSGMKSRVQRGRAMLRERLEACCEIELDARGKVTEFTPRKPACSTCK